jgi:hypothetical protein
MTNHNAAMDRMIASAVMPDDYKDWQREVYHIYFPISPSPPILTIKIQCHDCETKEWTHFHIYTAKCSQCKGYNTSVISEKRSG